MNSACLTLTQKPSARIEPGCATFDRTCSSTRRTQAWSAVRTFVSSLTSYPVPRFQGTSLKVDPVMNAVVRKRREVLLIDGVPDAQFSGNSAVEVSKDIEAVCPLGRGCQPEQLYGLQVLQQRTVRARCRMMELIHDHHIESRGVNPLNTCCSQALDRREDMFESRRPL